MPPPLKAVAWMRTHSEMSLQVLAHDWSSTPLGPMEQWPESLKAPVQLMLHSRQPMALAWGPDLICLHNDGFIPILGSKHPGGLGLPFRHLWSEIANEFEPMIEDIRHGKSIYFEDRPIALAGRPSTPISWFTFSWTPLFDEADQVQGFICVAAESTARILESQKLANLKLLLEDLELMTQSASWEIDLDSGQMLISEGMRRMLDLPPDSPDVTADQWRQFVHPDDHALRSVPLQQLLGAERHLLNEFRVITAKGQTRWLRCWVREMSKPDGSGKVMRGLAFDLTYRKFLEQGRDELLDLVHENQLMNRLLRKNYDKLEMTLDAAQLGLWELDLSTQTFTIDPRLAAMLGEDGASYRPTIEELQARMHPDDAAESYRALQDHLVGDSAFYETEYRIRHAMGHWIWLLANGRVVQRDSHGAALLVAGTVRNTTQAKSHAAQGTDLLQQIKRLIENMAESPRAMKTPSPDDRLLAQLTKRQRQMLELIAEGLTTARIAEALHISTGTAFTHRRDLMRKLNLRNAAEVTAFAIRHDLTNGTALPR